MLRFIYIKRINIFFDKILFLLELNYQEQMLLSYPNNIYFTARYKYLIKTISKMVSRYFTTRIGMQKTTHKIYKYRQIICELLVQIFTFFLCMGKDWVRYYHQLHNLRIVLI